MTIIAANTYSASQKTEGMIFGFLGMLIFSGSLPATRAAVAGFDPLFLTSARAVIAGLLGLSFLIILRAPKPQKGDILPLIGVMAGVVVGFPLLTALALKSASSSHSTVFIGLLPLATAVFGIFRGGERPKPRFWFFAIAGSLLTVIYALGSGGLTLSKPDMLLLLAILLCGYGYAEGARLARRLGGWQVISWALLTAMPLMLPLCFIYRPADFTLIEAPAWAGLAYVSLFSMMIGFIFWYRGLALGGTASVGQLQLLQPFFSFIIAAVLLGETVTWSMLAVTFGVIVCVTAARRNA